MNRRILLISDNKIFGHGGGSLEEHKYYDGLKHYANAHKDEVKVLSIDNRFTDTFLEPMRKNHKIDMLARVCGHSTYVFIEWLKYRKSVFAYKPDLIVLGRSRMGFIARDVHRYLSSCKIVCNMENVEIDYVDGYFADKENKLRALYKLWEKQCVKRDESTAIRYADALNYLTGRDLKRTHELYSVEGKAEMILPICIENATMLTKIAKGKAIVFIGSLSYGSNVNALMEFIQSVWIPYFADNKDVSFIIGGSNPNNRLKKMLKDIPNCTLYENFVCLEDVVPKGAMIIAPIQKGAGMKVKVAETLSMGLMIAASNEALVGYEQALEGDKLNGIISCKTSEEYRNAIFDYCSKTKKELSLVEIQNRRLYQKFYSYRISRQSISDFMSRLLI